MADNQPLAAPPEANPFDVFDPPPKQAANPFDNFDPAVAAAPASETQGANPFDKFDQAPAPGVVQTPKVDDGRDHFPAIMQERIVPGKAVDLGNELGGWLAPLQGNLAIGKYNLERSYAGLEGIAGNRTPEDLKHDFNQARLDKLKAAGMAAVPPNELYKWLGPVAEAAPGFTDLMMDAGTGATVGAGLGSLVPGIGTLGGAEAGGLSATAVSIGQNVSGEFYMDAIENDIPHEVAKPLALVAGVLVGAETAFGAPYLAAASRKLLGAQLKSELGQKLLKGYAGSILKGAGYGGAFGAASKTTELMAKHIAAAIANVPKAHPTGQDWLRDMATATLGNAAGGAGLGIGAKLTGSLLKHLFGKFNGGPDPLHAITEAFTEIHNVPVEEQIAKLKAEHEQVQEQIKTETEAAEAAAQAIVDKREQEIKDFHSSGGPDRYVPERITIEQAREKVKQKYEGRIEHQADMLQGGVGKTHYENVKGKPKTSNKTHDLPVPGTAETPKIDDGWENVYSAASEPRAPKADNPLSGHVEMTVAGAAPISRAEALRMAEKNFAKQIDAEAQAIVDANDKDIKASRASSRAPEPISLSKAREQVATNSKPSDLKRDASKLADQIFILESGAGKYDTEVPQTGREKAKALLSDFEKRRAAEKERHAQDAKDFQDALPKKRVGLLPLENLVQNWTAAVNTMLTHVKGEQHAKVDKILNMTPVENERATLIKGAITEFITLLGEGVGSVKRAMKLVKDGTVKRKWAGDYYDRNGDRKQLEKVSANELLGLHLRALDSGAHGGYANQGYTLKGQTAAGELSTQELIGQLLSEHENGDYLKLGEQLLTYWDRQHAGTALHYLSEYGEQLPYVPNYSGELKYETSGAHDAELTYAQRIDQMHGRTAIDPYSIRERVGAGDKKLKTVDIFRLAVKQTIEVSDWRAASVKQRQLDTVFNNGTTEKLMIEAFGEKFYQDAKVAYQFSVGSRKAQVEGRIAEADALLKNAATGYLGGNDPTQLGRQLTGWVNVIGSEVGPIDTMQSAVEALADVASKGKKGKFAGYLDKSAVYQERRDLIVQDVLDLIKDKSVIEFMQAPVKTVKHWGMTTTRWGGRVSDALAGYAVYSTALRKGMSEAEAILIADRAVDRTQSSTRPSQRTAMERSGTMGRVFVALQKQNIQVLNLELNAWRRLIAHHNDAKEVAKQVTTLAAIRIAALLFTSMARLPDLMSDDPNRVKSVHDWMVLNALLGGVATAPLMVQDVIQGAVGPEGRHPETIPGRAASNVQYIVRHTLPLIQAKINEGTVPQKEVDHYYRAMMDAATLATGVPFSNTARTIDRTKKLNDKVTGMGTNKDEL